MSVPKKESPYDVVASGAVIGGVRGARGSGSQDDVTDYSEAIQAFEARDYYALRPRKRKAQQPASKSNDMPRSNPYRLKGIKTLDEIVRENEPGRDNLENNNEQARLSMRIYSDEIIDPENDGRLMKAVSITGGLMESNTLKIISKIYTAGKFINQMTKIIEAKEKWKKAVEKRELAEADKLFREYVKERNEYIDQAADMLLSVLLTSEASFALDVANLLKILVEDDDQYLVDTILRLKRELEVPRGRGLDIEAKRSQLRKLMSILERRLGIRHAHSIDAFIR